VVRHAVALGNAAALFHVAADHVVAIHGNLI
jgi:hypothetical protein